MLQNEMKKNLKLIFNHQIDSSQILILKLILKIAKKLVLKNNSIWIVWTVKIIFVENIK